MVADTFVLEFKPSTQVPTRNFGVQDIADGESLATVYHRGGGILTQPAYMQSITGARRGIDFAIWNDIDSGKVLNVHRIDMTVARGVDAVSDVYDANMALGVYIGTATGGTPVDVLCLDAPGTAVPAGVRCVAAPETSGLSTVRNAFRQHKRWNAFLGRLGPDGTTGFGGEGMADLNSLFQHRGIAAVQPYTLRTGEAIVMSWPNSGFRGIEQSCHITFTDGSHTWVAKFEGVPLGKAPLAVANDSGSPLTITDVRQFEGATPVNGTNSNQWLSYYVRGIHEYIEGSGSEMTPVPISGGSWPSGVHCVREASVFHEAKPDRTDGRSDHASPLTVIQHGPLGFATTHASWIGTLPPGNTPTMVYQSHDPYVIRPGEGIGLDTDPPYPLANNVSGVSNNPIAVGFLFTVENAPPTAGGEHSYAYVT